VLFRSPLPHADVVASKVMGAEFLAAQKLAGEIATAALADVHPWVRADLTGLLTMTIYTALVKARQEHSPATNRKNEYGVLFKTCANDVSRALNGYAQGHDHPYREPLTKLRDPCTGTAARRDLPGRLNTHLGDAAIAAVATTYHFGSPEANRTAYLAALRQQLISALASVFASNAGDAHRYTGETDTEMGTKYVKDSTNNWECVGGAGTKDRLPLLFNDERPYVVGESRPESNPAVATLRDLFDPYADDATHERGRMKLRRLALATPFFA